jgi:hypothetical protein
MQRPQPPDSLQFVKARSRWEDNHQDAAILERREIRCLCQHPDTALLPAWVDALVRLTAFRVRRSWIEYLLGHYLGQWRSMANPDALEASLLTLVSRLPAQDAWVVELAAQAHALIGPDAPKRLVAALPDPLHGWEGLLVHWELSREAGLGRAIVQEALRAWEARWRVQRPELSIQEAGAELTNAFDGLLREPSLPNEDLCRVVSNLILSEWAKGEPEIREQLVELVLRHPQLGDPRDKKHQWYPMAQARDQFISWMARKDLRIFYDTVVADNADAQGRKAFWLHYVDRVADFRLVLSEDDAIRLSATPSDPPMQFAKMEGPNRTSAFILRFKSEKQADDLICVEFSKTGNSLYVYDASSFEAGVASMKALSFRAGSEPRDLKNREYCKWRKAHLGDWQWEVKWFLKENGILPG